jgi:hypothetical protein
MYPIKHVTKQNPNPKMKDEITMYSFGGRLHSQLAEIIGNLRFTPFKGRLGKPLQLTKVAGLSTATSDTLTRGKKNPLFDAEDDVGGEGQLARRRGWGSSLVLGIHSIRVLPDNCVLTPIVLPLFLPSDDDDGAEAEAAPAPEPSAPDAVSSGRNSHASAGASEDGSDGDDGDDGDGDDGDDLDDMAATATPAAPKEEINGFVDAVADADPAPKPKEELNGFDEE